MQIAVESAHSASTPSAALRAAAARMKLRILNKPGAYMDIPKEQLLIDHTYQRDRDTKSKVDLIISAGWDWMACGSLSVALRDDGKFYVMDGQHRRLAADKFPTITTLPCMVYAVEDVKEEAQGFLQANTARKPISAVDRFKAEIVVENSVTKAIEDMLTKDGYSIGPAPSRHVVSCVTALKRCHATNPAALKDVWAILVKLHPIAGVNHKLLQGLFYIRHNHKFNIAAPDVMKRLEKIGADELLRGATRSSAVYGKGGEKIWAVGIVQSYNKGVRTHRIPDIAV